MAKASDLGIRDAVGHPLEIGSRVQSTGAEMPLLRTMHGEVVEMKGGPPVVAVRWDDGRAPFWHSVDIMWRCPDVRLSSASRNRPPHDHTPSLEERMKGLRERAAEVKYRAEEDAAWIENERHDRATEREKWEREDREYEDRKAAEFVAEFLSEPFAADRLTRLDVPGWKQAWAFDLPEFGPMQVRLNVFHGLRLMDGSRRGDGRLVRTLADLIEPTSVESQSAAHRG